MRSPFSTAFLTFFLDWNFAEKKGLGGRRVVNDIKREQPSTANPNLGPQSLPSTTAKNVKTKTTFLSVYSHNKVMKE